MEAELEDQPIFRKKLGTYQASKTDEFLEKFQTAFDPPPHVRISDPKKICCRFFCNISWNMVFSDGFLDFSLYWYVGLS